MTYVYSRTSTGYKYNSKSYPADSRIRHLNGKNCALCQPHGIKLDRAKDYSVGLNFDLLGTLIPEPRTSVEENDALIRQLFYLSLIKLEKLRECKYMKIGAQLTRAESCSILDLMYDIEQLSPEHATKLRQICGGTPQTSRENFSSLWITQTELLHGFRKALCALRSSYLCLPTQSWITRLRTTSLHTINTMERMHSGTVDLMISSMKSCISLVPAFAYQAPRQKRRWNNLGNRPGPQYVHCRDGKYGSYF